MSVVDPPSTGKRFQRNLPHFIMSFPRAFGGILSDFSQTLRSSMRQFVFVMPNEGDLGGSLMLRNAISGSHFISLSNAMN